LSQSGAIRTLLLLAALIAASACASILDFPDRSADTADATSGGGSTGSGGSGGLESGVGAAGGSGGSSSDASLDAVADAPMDASTEGDAGGGGAGAISCGGVSCSVASGDVCCVDPATGSSSCTVANQCAASNVKVFCDEQADCLPGEICCAEVNAGTALAFPTECRASCNGVGSLQICRSSNECSGGQCKSRTCSGGAVVEACTGCP
jgi:hypothetical protein